MPSCSFRLAALLAPVVLLIASAQPAAAFAPGDKPASILPATVVSTHYDGVSKDILTAGLGQDGDRLGRAAARLVAAHREELRRSRSGPIIAL